ncbi:MAG TPA: SIMPL domain-containing protein [Actinomycetota bacterium]|nr:SIMPL domain-containing protein [Actinomycetota bacterium]
MSGRSGSAIGVLVIVALIATAVLVPTAGFGQTDTATLDTVTVTAAGTVEGRPDLATITFGIRTRAATAEATMEELAARQNAVIDNIRALGLPPEDVTTGNIGLQEACRYDRDLERTVCSGFVARTSVRAETSDFDLVGPIIDAGVEGGATSVGGVNFERTEENEAIQEALAEAMDLARTKAEVLATRAGRQLGRAMVIEEGGSRRPVFDTDEVFARASGGGTAAAFVINPADRITRVRIVVTFALN